MAYRIIDFLLGLITSVGLCALPGEAQQTAPVGVEVVNAVPDKELTRAFESLSGWTGGDAAYSVPLTKTRSLWLFGDTFIGKIENGVRTKADMVHNTAGWLNKRSGGSYSIRYSWKLKGRRPAALLEPSGNTKSYFWPGAITVNAGQLSVFCKLIVDKAGDDSGFGFDWIGQELVQVRNPLDTPANWQYTHFNLPGGEAGIFPGAGSFTYDSSVYIYSTMKSDNQHKCVLMRISPEDLARGETSKFQYLTNKLNEAGELQPDRVWSPLPLNVTTLFGNAAPEMSVSQVAGLPGFWAVYSENGLSANIMLRHSDKPEGPWSEPLVIYTAPEPSRDASLLCYGAKHHPELALQERTLVITYCLNPGPLKAHRTRPMLYFPKAVKVTLKPVP